MWFVNRVSEQKYACTVYVCCLHLLIYSSVNALEHAAEWWRIGSGSPAESLLDAIVMAHHRVCVSHVCVCSGGSGGGGDGTKSIMKGKLEPLIAVLTQGGSEGRPLRKERQESRDPGSVYGAQHN